MNRDHRAQRRDRSADVLLAVGVVLLGADAVPAPSSGVHPL